MASPIAHPVPVCCSPARVPFGGGFHSCRHPLSPQPLFPARQGTRGRSGHYPSALRLSRRLARSWAVFHKPERGKGKGSFLPVLLVVPRSADLRLLSAIFCFPLARSLCDYCAARCATQSAVMHRGLVSSWLCGRSGSLLARSAFAGNLAMRCARRSWRSRMTKFSPSSASLRSRLWIASRSLLSVLLTGLEAIP